MYRMKPAKLQWELRFFENFDQSFMQHQHSEPMGRAN